MEAPQETVDVCNQEGNQKTAPVTVPTVRFRPYASIENHDVSAGDVRAGGYAEGEWVVSEKVHGANFCFLTDGATVNAARRKALLKSQEKFYPGWEELLESYTERVLHAFRLVQEHNADTNQQQNRAPPVLYVFGELYGGMYPGLPTPHGQLHVQKGIYYAPAIEFYAFDLHDGRGYLDFDLAHSIFTRAGFFCAEPLLRGSFEECLAFHHEFRTTLPDRLGLPPLAGARYVEYRNWAEGTVIKPVRNQYFPTGSRVILKKKIDLYNEVIDVRKRDPNKIKLRPVPAVEVNDEQVMWLNTELARYINQNRLAAVVSKIGHESHVRHKFQNRRGQLTGLLSQDALADLLKRPEANERYKELNKDRKHLVTHRLNALASGAVRAFYEEGLTTNVEEPQA